MRTVFSFALGAAAGAAAAHFARSDSDRKWRNKPARRPHASTRSAVDAGPSAPHDEGRRPRGHPHRHEEMDDQTLADRVRSEIFRDHDAPKGERLRRRPGRRRLPARRGRRQAWIERLGTEARKVQGINGVKNLLHTPGTPAPAAEPRSPRRRRSSSRSAARSSRAPGWPSPGQGASTISRRASVVALTAWRSLGSNTAAAPAPPVVPAELDLAVDHHDVGALVHLVLLQLLPGGEVDQDRPRLAAGGVQDLRLMRLDVERAQVPVLHGRGAYSSASARRLRAGARSPGG